MKGPWTVLKDISGILLFVVVLIITIPMGYQAAQRDFAAKTSTPPASPAGNATGDSKAALDGPQAVYLEADSSFTSSDVWSVPLTTPIDFNQRRRLATFQHRTGYPPQGKVSPDGKQIAFLVIPEEASEQAARTNGGQVWVMDADGSNLRRLANGAAELIDWRPDSQAVAYTSYVPLADPADPNIPFRTDLYSVTVDGAAPQPIYSDQTAYGLTPLGWSADGAQFYWGKVDLQGQWSLAGIDSATGDVYSLSAFTDGATLTSLALSPDRRHVLAGGSTQGQADLWLVDLGEGALQAVATAPLDGQGLSPFTALWAAAGSRLLVRQTGDASQKPADLFSLAISAETSVELQSMEPIQDDKLQTLTPIAWGSDPAWLVWRDYPASGQPLYLENTASGTLAPMLRSAPDHTLEFIGWLP